MSDDNNSTGAFCPKCYGSNFICGDCNSTNLSNTTFAHDRLCAKALAHICKYTTFDPQRDVFMFSLAVLESIEPGDIREAIKDAIRNKDNPS